VEPRLNERIRIATSGEPLPVEISWDGSRVLRGRLVASAGSESIVAKLDGSGTSAEVHLDLDEKQALVTVLEAWLMEVGKPGLPDGVFELRNRLRDDLHAAGLEPDQNAGIS
jgi:hypothetical protein